MLFRSEAFAQPRRRGDRPFVDVVQIHDRAARPRGPGREDRAGVAGDDGRRPAGPGGRRNVGVRQRRHRSLLYTTAVGGDITMSGPLLTKTLLIYALTTGGSSGGPRLVAYDKASGKELHHQWRRFRRPTPC